ncbi:hypothetical protein qdsa001_175 [Staphylococcus phage qdsa001]|nr:hypothetical protein qdsa001_175 [Staphylococcus phage qdsa001]QXV86189.1 hypothetical protein [Staphylococcus phage SAPYZU_15]UGL60785.1 hypothetical protein [Staphylococcus phage vB_SauM-HM01]UVD42357.1 hypothetical protein [Staphylococcus phage vB_SauM-V1SA19]WBF47874.1 hypothetical protein SSP49_49 [Staphylococcus phage SSP49]
MVKYLRTKAKKTNVSTLFKKLQSKDITLLGVSYDSDYFPSGVTIIPYLEDISQVEDGIEFTNKVIVTENLKPAIVGMNNMISDSGLGYVKTEQLNKRLENTGLMTDLLSKGTELTSTKKVDIVSTFIEPTIMYQDTTINKELKLRLYTIEDVSPLNDYTHVVYLLVTDKQYDGQSFIGTLCNQGILNKLDTIKVLTFFKGNNLINRSVFSVKLNTNKYHYSLYNTHETGIFFLDDDKDLIIACGQSYVKVRYKDIVSSKVEKVSDNNYKMVVNLVSNDELTILL